MPVSSHKVTLRVVSVGGPAFETLRRAREIFISSSHTHTHTHILSSTFFRQLKHKDEEDVLALPWLFFSLISTSFTLFFPKSRRISVKKKKKKSQLRIRFEPTFFFPQRAQ